MKQAEKQGKENARSTSSDRVVIRPSDSNEAKEGCVKEAQGIMQGDAKKAGEGLLQEQKEQRGGA